MIVSEVNVNIFFKTNCVNWLSECEYYVIYTQSGLSKLDTKVSVNPHLLSGFYSATGTVYNYFYNGQDEIPAK